MVYYALTNRRIAIKPEVIILSQHIDIGQGHYLLIRRDISERHHPKTVNLGQLDGQSHQGHTEVGQGHRNVSESLDPGRSRREVIDKKVRSLRRSLKIYLASMISFVSLLFLCV